MPYYIKSLLNTNLFLEKILYVSDLEDIDPDLTRNLQWTLENYVEDLDFNFW